MINHEAIIEIHSSSEEDKFIEGRELTAEDWEDIRRDEKELFDELENPKSSKVKLTLDEADELIYDDDFTVGETKAQNEKQIKTNSTNKLLDASSDESDLDHQAISKRDEKDADLTMAPCHKKLRKSRSRLPRKARIGTDNKLENWANNAVDALEMEE